MDPELKEYFDAWFAKRERDFDNLMALMGAFPSPTGHSNSTPVVTTDGVVAPVPASAGTAELVTASVGLAEAPTTVPIVEESLAVALAAPIDTVDVVPTTCSTDCVVQATTMSTALLPWASMSSASPSSPGTSTTNGKVYNELAPDNDGQPVKGVTSMALTPTSEKSPVVTQAASNDTITVAPMFCSTECTTEVVTTPSSTRTTTTPPLLWASGSSSSHASPARSTTNEVISTDLAPDKDDSEHGVSLTVALVLSSKFGVPVTLSTSSTTEVVLAATLFGIPWALTRPWLEPVPPRPPDPWSLFPGAWSGSRPEAKITMQSAVKTIRSCNSAEEVPTYEMSDKVLHHNEFQWPPWPPPWSMRIIPKGHMFRSKPFPLAECNQEGIPPAATCSVQYWLGPPARPKPCAHSPSNNHTVGVTLLTHSFGDPLCKLLSPRYQDFGDNNSIPWALEQERHTSVSAAGHVHHVMFQSDSSDIYQLITHPGEYSFMWLQPKPTWLYILIKIDTEDEERGVHQYVEELTFVHLMFKLLLRRPYLVLPMGIYLYELQLARRRMEDTTPQRVLNIMHCFQLQCHAVIFAYLAYMILYRSNLASASGKFFWESKKLELINWVSYIPEQYSDMSAYGIKPGLLSLCESTSRPLMQDAGIPHRNNMELCMAARELFLLQNQDHGWIYPGSVLLCCCHTTLLSAQGSDEDGIVTRKQYRVLVQHTKVPWDPGGSTWCQWFSTCDDHEPFQGGRDVMGVIAYVEQFSTSHKYYLDFANANYCMAAFLYRVPVNLNDFYIEEVYLDLGYYRDCDQIKEHRLQWDPGGFSVTSAWGQAEFQEGRDVRSLYCRYTYMGWSLGLSHGLGPPSGPAGYKYTRRGSERFIHVGSRRTAAALLSHLGSESLFPFMLLLVSSY